MFSQLLSITAFGLAIFSLVLIIRNKWVLEQRDKLNKFEGGVHLIKRYAAYDTMVLKFWIWDIEKFKLSNHEN